MIIDQIAKINRYAYIPNVQKAVDFLSKPDLISLENGKYDLGDSCWVNVSSYETKELPEGDIALEAHRNYLDIQLTIAGEEAMLFQTIDIGEENKAYNPEKDIEFFTAPWTNQVVLDGTNFALIFPNDLHAGSFTVDIPNTVKKFVFKLKID